MMEPPAASKKSTGFTLLELMLSLSIFALVATAVVGLLHSGLRACARGRQVSESLQLARIALGRMVEDLESVYYSDSVLCTDFLGEDASDGSCDTDRLTLVTTARFARADAVGEADLTALEYFIDTGGEAGEEGLSLSQTRVLLAVVEEEAEQVCRLGAQIVGLNLRYFDGLDWQDSWDASAKGALPRAVEITVAVRESGKRPAGQQALEEEATRKFTTAVALPAQAREIP